MTSPAENGFEGNGAVADAERTLRLLATLPAPRGLEERVKAGLHAAPSRGMVVAWPFSADARGWMSGASARAAAAAAIVLVVAGGGWGVYSHIQLAPTPSAIVQPQVPAGAGGFSAAGATRKPQTLEGPVVAAPITAREEPDSSGSDLVLKTQPTGQQKRVYSGKHAHASAKAKSSPVPVIH